MRTPLAAAGAVVAAAPLWFAVGIWLLSQGPVSLAFLAPPLERALEAEHPEFDIALGTLTLGWSSAARAFGIAASDAHARRRDGAARIHIPEMTVALEGLALAHGVVAPRRLEVFGPTIHVMRRPSESAGPDRADSGELADRLGDTLRQAPEILSQVGSLSVLEAFDATIVARGPAPGVEDVWTLSRVSLERREESIFATATASVTLDGEPFELEAAARYDAASGALTLRAAFADLVPARLAALSPALAAASEYDLEIGGEIVMEGAADGRIEALSFDLASGPGVVPAPPPYLPGTRLSVAGVRAAGRLEDGFHRLSLDRAEVDLFGPTVAVSGEIGGDWTSPDAALEIVARAVPLDDLDTWWPHDVAPGARPWAVANMSEGVLDTLEARIDVRGDEWDAAYVPADRVDGRLSISDATVAYLDGMPAAREVRVAGRFDALGLTAEIETGRVGPLAVRNGAIDIRDAPETAGRARIDIAFSGDLGETMAALQRSPLGLGGLDIDPARVSGAAEGNLTVALPLVVAEEDALDIAVTAALRRVALAPAPGGEPFEGRGIGADLLELSVRADGFELSGEARVDGVPADVVWRESFASETAEGQRGISFSAVLDTANRERLGLGVSWLEGPVAVEGRVVADEGKATTVDIDLDAGAAAADLPSLPWLKPAGVPAVGHASLTLDDDGIAEVSRFELSSDDLETAGAASRRDDGVWKVSLERFVSGRTDVSGEILAGDDAVTALLQGAALDLRAAGQSGMAESAESAESAFPALFLSARVDTLALDEGLTLDAADVLLSWDGREIDKAEIAGRLAGGAPILVRLRDDPEAEAPRARLLTVDTDDAGQLLDALEITPNMVGGNLAVEARVEGDIARHPLSGVLRIEDFRMVDSPVLAEMLSLLSIDIIGALQTLGGEGVGFDRFEAPYVYRDGVLALDGAFASGASLGITIDGSIDFRGDNVDVRGQVAPFNTINRIVGAVPLIGDLLTGGEGGGIFATSYRVEGARADPSVAVNPLTMLLPGPLREIMPDG